MNRRTIVYVDGFNLYYGCLKRSKHKWLDLEKYFTRLRTDDTLERVYFFTALVNGEARERQITYLEALKSTPKVEVVLGRFKNKDVKCRVQGCCHEGERTFSSPAEKHTDVSIALQMLDDAWADRCDVMILVSGDSDLVPAVRRIRSQFQHMKVIVYVPTLADHQDDSTEIRMVASHHRNLPLNLLEKCQFPAEFDGASGSAIRKPKQW